METKLHVIRRLPLFADWPKRRLEQVAALADELDLPAGKALTTEGASGREFVILVEGIADVVQDGEVVNKLGPGDFLGEIALVTGEPRTATVVTRSPAKLLVMNAASFRSLLHDAPALKQRVLATAALRATA